MSDWRPQGSDEGNLAAFREEILESLKTETLKQD